MPRKDPDNPALAVNKKAFHDYIVEERFEAGVQLAGTEVKSCRDRAVVIGDAFVQIRNSQAWIVNMHISPYGFGNRFNHDPRQERRLLLHKNEILKLAQNLKTKGGTVIPLRVYLNKGLVKLELAYCHGKTHGDKRETLRERQADMEMRRSVKR